jgi:hypothetical protein
MLYEVNVFGSRLITWAFQQIVVYDIFQRKTFFYSDHLTEKFHPSFAVVRDVFVLIGGSGSDEEDVKAGQTSEFQIVPYRLSQSRKSSQLARHA